MENFVYISDSEEKTKEFGKKLARMAKKGDFFALFGTLGVGKSVLSRAFIEELTGAKEVPSPTFTLLQTYEAPDFDIYHFDLYRIKSGEEIFEIGMEEAMFGGVSLVEWPEKMKNFLPADIFKIEIISEGSSKRTVKISTLDTQKQKRLKELK